MVMMIGLVSFGSQEGYGFNRFFVASIGSHTAAGEAAGARKAKRGAPSRRLSNGDDENVLGLL